MNWERYILQAMPVRKRGGIRYYLLIWYLTSWIRKKWKEDKEYIESLEEELRYTSQVLEIKELIEKHYGIEIEIEDYRDAKLSFVYSQGSIERTIVSREKEDSWYVIGREDEDAGWDFRIRVPEGVDKEDVKAYVKRYVFPGLKFEILYRDE